MAMFGADGSAMRSLSAPASAAKAWAQLAQESLARPAPAWRAASMRAR